MFQQGKRGKTVTLKTGLDHGPGRHSGALITNPPKPPKAGRPMWVYARKSMFSKGAATPGLNKVDGIMIKANKFFR